MPALSNKTSQILKTKAIFLFIVILLISLYSRAQSLNANFSSDITRGCTPIVVNFKDISTGNPKTWSWDFGNGATSTKKDPATTYLSAGKYTVTLTVTNDAGTHTITRTQYISVFDGPKADFAADKLSSCSPGRIQFTDQSTPSAETSITGWQWEFGDGATSTEQNPKHVYRSPGNYTVILRVTNNIGCSQLIPRQNYISISAGVVPAFSNTLPDKCQAPALVEFTNTTSGPDSLTYRWDFGDGTTSTETNPTHTYRENKDYTVVLIATSNRGCMDTLKKANAVSVGSYKSDFRVQDTACATKRAGFVNTTTPVPASFTWIFEDGTTSTERRPFKTYAAGGSYAVTLINQFPNCRDTITKNISIAALPDVQFSASDSVRCEPPLPVNFRNTAINGASYFWDFGDSSFSRSANPSHTYTRPGFYPVSLKVISPEGCTDSLVKPAYIRIQKPVVNVQNLPQRGCLPFEFKPIPSINSVDSAVSYRWDFGDGATATGRLPTHTYTVQGTYTVTLTLTTSTGCTETTRIAGAVKVGTKPTAAFSTSTTDVCASQSIQFNNESPDPTDEYLWQFGDGGISTAKNPAYQFRDTGLQDVTLIAFNSGCGDTLRKPNYVHIKPPIANFTFRPNCDKRTEYSFTDKSIGALSWVWDFGDGTPAVNGQNPAPHTYPGLGNYTVSLTVANGSCSYATSQTVNIVDQTPDITVSAREGCKNFTPNFSATSPVQVVQSFWRFGDGNSGIAHGASAAHTYRQSGDFDVQVIATDIYGCLDSVSKTQLIRVNGPVANFGSLTNQGCRGLNTTFLDSSLTDGRHALVRWEWDFGDSTAQGYNQAPFSHVYDTIGDFSVKLVVRDEAGCRDSLTRTNYVRISTITADWEAVRESCPQSPIQFVNKTNHGAFTNTWYFGDGSSSPTLNPVYNYADTGLYSIKLIVRDTLGCEDSLVRDNFMRIGLPVASFTANNLSTYCTPFEAMFKNTSHFYQNWSWDLGISTSTQKDPTAYYTQTGTYPIKLTVVSPGGCRDSVSKNLTVYNPRDGQLNYNPLQGCTPLPIQLDAFTEMDAQFVWDFGDGNVVDTNVHKIGHVYQNFGQFLPRIILNEPSGCVVALEGKDTVHVLGVKTRFSLNEHLFCDSGLLVTSDSTIFNDPIRTYHWTFGDGGMSNLESPGHYYQTPGNYQVKQFVETQAGCVDSSFAAVKVVQSPLIATSGDTVICLNERVRYSASLVRPDTSALRWQWDFPNGNREGAQNPQVQLYKNTGRFSITTIATNSSGCADTTFLPLLVHPLPTIQVPPTFTLLAGSSITIPALYSSNVTSYVWSPTANLSCSNCPQPVLSPKLDTKYTITVQDNNGCSNSAETYVDVICQNANVFVPNTFSPNGDGSNDIFYIRGSGIDRVKTLRVLNRWGEIVFEQKEFPVNNASFGWNGRYKGSHPQPDVYVYQVEVYCDNGEIIRFHGNVALIQ